MTVFNHNLYVPSRKSRTANRRSQVGSQITEFASALIVLVLAVGLPLFDLAMVPLRWILVQDAVNSWARSLSMCETYSNAYRLVEDKTALANAINSGGVALQSCGLQLKINRICPQHVEEMHVLDSPRQISAAWLPDGSMAPCLYSLVLEVQVLISPAVQLPNALVSIPGLTAPIPFSIRATHPWANLGRDPSTGIFYLNE